jgi:hypothetical protein
LNANRYIRGKEWAIAVWGTLLLSTLKSMRLPNDFALAHYLITYDEGFVRRGLVGEILRLCGAPFFSSYEFISVLAAITLAANIWLLGRAAREFCGSSDLVSPLVAVAYTSSLGVVYLVHTIGYFDQFAVLFALILARLTRYRARLLLCTSLGTALLFVHEGTLVMFLPLECFSLLLVLSAEPSKRKWEMLGVSLFAVVQVFATWFIGVHGVLTEASARRLQALAETRANFVICTPVFDILHNGSAGTFFEIAAYFRTLRYWVASVDSVIIVAPTLLVLVSASTMILRRNGQSRLFILGAIIAGCAPMALRFLAGDLHRWDAMAVTTSFLVLQMVWRHSASRGSTVDWPRWSIPVLVLVIAIGASSRTFLFNDEYVKQYPFFEYRAKLTKSMHLPGR